MTTCSATVGRRPVDFGFVPAQCGQVVGVTRYLTTGNIFVGYCSREGHETSVRRQFAEMPEPSEPEWDLPEGLDPITMAKGDNARWGF